MVMFSKWRRAHFLNWGLLQQPSTLNEIHTGLVSVKIKQKSVLLCSQLSAEDNNSGKMCIVRYFIPDIYKHYDALIRWNNVIETFNPVFY